MINDHPYISFHFSKIFLLIISVFFVNKVINLRRTCAARVTVVVSCVCVSVRTCYSGSMCD